MIVFSGLVQMANAQDSVTVAVAPEYEEAGNVHRMFLGTNYRKVWATPVKMRVWRLNQEKGGLIIIKRGGGMQTKSLRLQDATGKEWVLRSIQKDPQRVLPENLRGTFAKDVLQDQISTSHPYAALTVPPLAAALGVLHAKPEIVYVQDDPALGEYRKDFAGQVFLFEEREPSGPNGSDNTGKVLKKVQESPKTTVNQRRVLRARLLDMVLGDWDRHEDQWHWQEEKGAQGTAFVPVPRDRDQVFTLTSGIVPKVASCKWLMPRFQGFHEEVRDINGFNFNARYFDRLFLHELNDQDWKAEIESVQAALTDQVIETAVRQMPAVIYALSGEEIMQKLLSRRNLLEQEALKYYRFLSKEVDVPASDKGEVLQVHYAQGGAVEVKLFKKAKDGSNGPVLYQRVFLPKVTQEVRLYGRGGKDEFLVTGNSPSPIKVRLIGGDGEDTYQVQSTGKAGQLLVYDRADEENVLPTGAVARLKTSKDSLVNHYNPRSFQYDRVMPLVSGGYNVDEGPFLGAGLLYTRHGFQKEPFAARHRLMVGHAVTTKALFARYTGDFTKAIGQYDLHVDVDAKAPTNASNFFGIGNETRFLKNEGSSIKDYRTRYDFVSAQVALNRSLGQHWRASAGLQGQFYSNKASEQTSRIMQQYNAVHPEEQVFSTKVYAGLVAGLTLDTRDNTWLPTKGLHWKTTFTGLRQLNNQQDALGLVASELSFYHSLGREARLTLANRIGGGTTVGDPAFFQLLYLGGNTNLRGFRNYRFAGEHMAYHNLELRLKLFDFSSYLLPGTFGLVGFNDMGRVWAEGESSKQWHHGYGGGFYLVPAQMFLIQAGVGMSVESTTPYVALGFRF
ncbi:hypothetical protein DC20_07665 [Rufibacter tibetensis]|uniref:Bacterial surface antigen (D15) domain-containing protein n=2 Tax=Rufibacter tibetensis TaxID=512763 RepID=A0A0N7HX79_9BACT|nr:hypothetical protein DC20_07665 [Rufibacter tibetensis]